MTVAFSYRNAAQASVTARSVDMKRWQEERMDKVQTSARWATRTGKSIPAWGPSFSICCIAVLRPLSGEEIKGKR
ncbi:MAG: hypothetical protein ACLT8E_07905 [Akkermansia sp.]